MPTLVGEKEVKVITSRAGSLVGESSPAAAGPRGCRERDVGQLSPFIHPSVQKHLLGPRGLSRGGSRTGFAPEAWSCRLLTSTASELAAYLCWARQREGPRRN